ncbi:hypothetical protein CCHR01_16452 [Colletotrichum chrysophilum]|uniref:Uncharacterized protein n=1 Tax=Colletotrichum chrysophilum TaxID=1836956 RepID=A0AAD9A3S5_9PEZI|nr:hypothetical protein CCHR01_16452 [Colletotrichum chrysophilum]
MSTAPKNGRRVHGLCITARPVHGPFLFPSNWSVLVLTHRWSLLCTRHSLCQASLSRCACACLLSLLSALGWVIHVHGLVLPSFCISQRHSISKSGLSLFNRSTSAPSSPRRISSRSYKLHLSSLPLETPGLSLHARPSWTLGNGRDRFRSCFVTPFFQLRRGRRRLSVCLPRSRLDSASLST